MLPDNTKQPFFPSSPSLMFSFDNSLYRIPSYSQGKQKAYSKISKAINTIAARKIRGITYREFTGWIFQVI